MPKPAPTPGIRWDSAGYMSDMTAQLPLLLAVGFAPVAVMLLLVIVTRLESSPPADGDPHTGA